MTVESLHTATAALSATGPDRPAIDRIVQRKKALIFGLSAGACLFFFTLPVLSFFTTTLDGPAYGSVTWAYVFMLAQFAVSLICVHVFLVWAAKFDAEALFAQGRAIRPVGDIPS